MPRRTNAGANMTNVAVVGAGLIGRAWAIVFARAGFSVTLWDRFPQQQLGEHGCEDVTESRCRQNIRKVGPG